MWGDAEPPIVGPSCFHSVYIRLLSSPGSGRVSEKNMHFALLGDASSKSMQIVGLCNKAKRTGKKIGPGENRLKKCRIAKFEVISQQKCTNFGIWVSKSLSNENKVAATINYEPPSWINNTPAARILRENTESLICTISLSLFYTQLGMHLGSTLAGGVLHRHPCHGAGMVQSKLGGGGLFCFDHPEIFGQNPHREWRGTVGEGLRERCSTPKKPCPRIPQARCRRQNLDCGP